MSISITHLLLYFIQRLAKPMKLSDFPLPPEVYRIFYNINA